MVKIHRVLSPSGGEGMEQLAALRPERIGRVFHSTEPVDFRWAMRLLRRVPDGRRCAARRLVRLVYWPLTAKAKIRLLGLASAVTLLILAGVDGVLGAPADTSRRWALDYLFDDSTELSGVSLSLLQDPAGLIVLVVVFVTPVFCSQQVRAIADFVQMNVRNGGAEGLSDLQVGQHNRLVRRTNKWLAALGRPGVSAAIAVAMATATIFLYGLVNTHGLLETWNPTELPDSVWRSEVYDGWWANRHTHPELAVGLCAAGTYAFYFLTKQLVMGVVFTVYLYRSEAIGFGVTPNMRFDSDGFRGLRPLRQFMLWTYGSAVAHLIGLLALFMIWLSAASWMVFVVLAVMVVDILVVVYPSSIGYHSALVVKQNHVKWLYQTLPEAERDPAIAKVWAAPVLPVTTRKATTGLTLYLLVPAIPALIPVLFQRI
ncbi:hypothetical protein ACOT81_30775 [Streptomyces sp. WI04-05B]|uniref:hypothetical protein n=1 Tax=Streptomyces TaxID=1883 RepID=UPI0029B611FB|nr:MULTISPECIES: hypothetical protein [unclassified Streptomyces]MDX2542324.1 hypothetical protein [Streptomyces sp. WI04-05B]MDX2584156.1 hypothetical protein [Streptomyces sp. WI04-05A]MDX3751143.1 hypothetical protein [Streptomyces sp. AK08-02]